MKHNPKFSIRDRFHEVLWRLRAKINIKPSCTVPELARRCGLPIELLDGIPQKTNGWLDPDEKPRYISVNRSQPLDQQVYSIALALGLNAHQRRCNSLLLDRPWKWETLQSAPAHIRQLITQLDVKHRAWHLMLAYATGSEFRAFIKRHGSQCFATMFADKIVLCHLLRLRLQPWIRSCL